ncbi:MAG: DUF3450 domain-containing protein [Sphingomonadales bacterium]
MRKHSVRSRVLCAVAAMSLTGFVGAASADALDQILQTGIETQRQAQESQERIDRIVDQTNDLLAKYKTVLKEIEGLQVYNAQLERQISNQEREKAEITDSIERVTETERQVMPLMLRMVDALEQFIELDIPFQKEVRMAGIEDLRDLMDRSDVTTAEKFRNVLETYQVESAYGRTFEAYEGTVDIDGQEQIVDFLQVGRISLLYQSRDSETSGAWNNVTRSWEILPSSYRNSITQGLRVARRQAAADRLLPLPIPAPEQAQ